MEIYGVNGTALVFTDNVEETAINQIKGMLDHPMSKGSTIRVMPDVHAGAGSTIGTTIMLPEKRGDWRISPNVVGVDIGCLDKDTEILTTSGWVPISDYQSEEIMVYDVETNKGFFEKPLFYLKKECDEFTHFKNSKGLDQMVSDEHRMLVFKGYKSRGYSKEFLSPADLLKKNLDSGYYSFKSSFELDSATSINYSDDEIRLIAMISSDGTVRDKKEGSTRYELHFKKERKISRAFTLLEKLDIEYSTYLGKDGTIYINFKTERFYDKDLSPFYLANKEQLKVLYNEIIEWDGHRNEKDTLFYSTDKTNADVIQYAITSNDIRAGLYSQKGDESHSVVYQVRKTENNIVGYSSRVERVRSTDGFKYCFNTSTGAFVARRNNKIFLTGNCGMMSYNIGDADLDLEKVDIEIKRAVPVGTNVHSSPKEVEFTHEIYHNATFKAKNEDRIKASLGTLGGGNHFIEISVDENGDKWLTVHSGSRNFGLQVAKHHQKIAEDLLGHKDPLAFLQGELLENYLKDMSLAQEYAKMNRKVMLDLISTGCGFSIKDSFDSIHNFIDIKNGIIRKGATSAEDGERLIIPLNMRDGSLVCSGKGNLDWNYSAPHGAGRAMGRREAKSKLSFEDYKKTMSGVYSTSLSLDNIDEAPMAYKPAENILRNIPDTAEVVHHLKPIYNRKG